MACFVYVSILFYARANIIEYVEHDMFAFRIEGSFRDLHEMLGVSMCLDCKMLEEST